MHPDNAYSKVSVNRTTVLQSTIPTICGGRKQEQEEGVDETWRKKNQDRPFDKDIKTNSKIKKMKKKHCTIRKKEKSLHSPKKKKVSGGSSKRKSENSTIHLQRNL